MNAYGYQKRPITPKCEALFGKLLAALEAEHHVAVMPPETAPTKLPKAGSLKRQVVDIIRTQDATYAEISAQLGITAKRASSLLSILRAERIVTIVAKTPAASGWSVNVYRIAEAA